MWEPIFKKANLYGVDFTGADLSRADLREADMTGAKIARADFTYAKLQGSIGTNGKPWGFTSKKEQKKPWWKVWRPPSKRGCFVSRGSTLGRVALKVLSRTR